MSVVKNYDQLRVYQIAFQAAMRILELSKKWPSQERYSLTDQIRRSSRSVCANIAEAWRKRRYPAHFASKLSDADAELAETDVWLNFAQQCEYLSPEDFDLLHDGYDNVCRKLSLMISDSESWCKNQRSSYSVERKGAAPSTLYASRSTLHPQRTKKEDQWPTHSYVACLTHRH